MSNSKNPGHGQARQTTASNSFGDLIQHSLKDSPTAKKAYERLRTTYLKDEYRNVFPSTMIQVEPRSVGAIDSRERDFRFSINKDSKCFIRNLWFAHQFLPRPRDVVRFLATAKPDEHRKMFEQRVEELKTLASTYTGWLKAADGISKKLENFKSTKTDLLASLEDPADSPKTATASPTPPGSAAVADMIREVEQRASYQAGDPDDACEKALYFLALGRPDIGEIIAREVLAENPDHAVALYANAVLLLNASERHRQQAFVHDVMHPHGLEPIEAEEFYHADRCAQESLQAMEKESQAFLLMLKARQNWPKQFSIKCYDLSPSMWQHKVEEWILWQAAARLAENGRELSLSKREDAETALKALRWIIDDIWKARSRSLFHPLWADFMRRFIIVAAYVDADVSRECLRKLESALDHPKLEETELRWRDVDMVLPVSQEPTLAATMIPAVTDSRFCLVVFAMRPTVEAAALLRRITHAGLSDERDRRTVMRSLAIRKVVLNIAHGGGFTQATELCRETAERHDWPATETGKKFQACWRYAAILLLFESSRAAFEMNDLRTAAEQAALALQLATHSLETITGEKPLLKHFEWDEYGDTEVTGNFLDRRPNIVTDTSPSDFFPPITPWEQANQFHVHHKACWDDFVKWANVECTNNTPVLLAYGRWLARQHGQVSLQSQCDALAVKLDSLHSK